MALKPVRLYGEQKRVLFLPVTDPIQIKGVAGSGKTTVALYRAKHLLETHADLFEESKVAIFTYNKSLVKYIKALLPQIAGGYEKDSDQLERRTMPGLNVEVTNFDKWAYGFLESRGVKLKGKILEGRAQAILIERAIENNQIDSQILKKSPEFFLEEIAWIKGKLFVDKQAYVESKRTGRGTSDRVTKNDKEVIWQIYLSYENQRKLFQTYDFGDLAILCLEKLIKSDLTPPYTHLIIDEAQDLSKAEIMVLTRIVSNSTRSISIIADAAQRIYKSGFTWTEVGINVIGARTTTFKKNYRNTESILMAAISLLDKEPDKSDFTEVQPSRKGGDKPILRIFESWETQSSFIVNLLLSFEGKDESTVLLHRNHEGLRKMGRILALQKIPFEEILNQGTVHFESNSVKICTLSSVKGLEFDNVIIYDLNDDVIPYPEGFGDENDEVHISTERRLLYTAMTRARERLFLLSSGYPSRYLNEIDEKAVIKDDNMFGINGTALVGPLDDLPF
jgi:superfamily I DNA/RNA helicase